MVLVSVVIIFYNAEKFLEEAIESVLQQSYTNWELLLVDDGSNDKSTWIAKNYAEIYADKIFYLEHVGHTNRGMPATRNLGVQYAQGHYIALLDADDVWLPKKLEQQVAALDANPPAGMVYGRSLYWNSWNKRREDGQQDYSPELGIPPNSLIQPPALLTLLYPLGKLPPPCPSDLLIRRAVIKAVGGFEEEFIGSCQLYEDQAFLAKLYLKFSVLVTDQCWDKYRLHPDSCSSRVEKAGQYDMVRTFYLKWLAKYLVKQKVFSPWIWKALCKARLPYNHPVLYRVLKRLQYPLRKHLTSVK